MNYKILFYLFFIFILFQQNTYGDEININSSKIKVLEEGNIINAFDVTANIPSKKIEIEGDESIYDKKKSQLTIINNDSKWKYFFLSKQFAEKIYTK